MADLNKSDRSKPESVPPDRVPDIQQQVAELYQAESRRVFATLIRVLGDFDLAEEALSDAFAAALEQWSREGIPANPRAWLVSAGRFKAIDTIRRRKRFDASLNEIAARLGDGTSPPAEVETEGTEDDRLRLIFTCCHPALSAETQVALTLREVCGLKTEDIASAFLSSPSTIAQRIVRGKAKIREANIPYQMPPLTELPDRLDSVLAVIYLVFNEGYSASSGETVTRADLSAEAIRLGRLLQQLLPDPEIGGLLGLMLLQESRRLARTSPSGDLVLLEDQDRTLWNRQFINEGQTLVARSLITRRFGAYTVQAAIAAVHANAQTAADTDWRQIVALYDLLTQADPSPVVQLNRAVAVAMRDGPQPGLDLVEAILADGTLAGYHLAHATRGYLHRRLGQTEAARGAYETALKLAKQAPERRFLQRCLDELS